MRVRTVAPAKINWTLEVLGRREDGYHEIRSVMQTIDLCDGLWAEASEGSSFETTEGSALPDDDLIVRAAKALEERSGRPLPARICVEKRIPVASGLGGGSSDAAAVLRLLNRLHELRLPEAELSDVGASVGSDVAFFAYGGTALVEGRGERVTSLLDASAAWFTIIVPKIDLPDKTRRMYARLTPADYTDGSITGRVVAAVSNGRAMDDNDTCNAFDRANFDLDGDLQQLSDGLFMEVLSPVHTVGAGPSIFVYCDDRSRADWACDYAEAFMFNGKVGTIDAPDSVITVDTFVARTLKAVEATAVTD
jgi:4-diphosphocytidyl-2-C-methyl-D-erythritol kinase